MPTEATDRLYRYCRRLDAELAQPQRSPAARLALLEREHAKFSREYRDWAAEVLAGRYTDARVSAFDYTSTLAEIDRRIGRLSVRAA